MHMSNYSRREFTNLKLSVPLIKETNSPIRPTDSEEGRADEAMPSNRATD